MTEVAEESIMVNMTRTSAERMQAQALYSFASPCQTSDLVAGAGTSERQHGILVGNRKPATLSW